MMARRFIQKTATRGRKLREIAVGLLLAVVLAALPGCAYYSFTGASIPGHLSNVAIPLAEDASVNPFTDLDDQLTQLLLDRIVGRTRLSLASDEDDADAVLTARIERYQNQPTSVGGDERAALNRVTITVQASYFDQQEDEERFQQQTFRAFEDYDPVEEGEAGERRAAQAALESIAESIFTSATSDW